MTTLAVALKTMGGLEDLRVITYPIGGDVLQVRIGGQWHDVPRVSGPVQAEGPKPIGFAVGDRVRYKDGPDTLGTVYAVAIRHPFVYVNWDGETYGPACYQPTELVRVWYV